MSISGSHHPVIRTKPVEGVPTHRVEEHIAARAAPRQLGEQRAVDQAQHRGDHRVGRDSVTSNDRARRVQTERTGEHGEPAEE
jgi:hypothetical protein